MSPFIEFDERDDKKEVEFWSGLRDLNNAKIYEGDIVAHYIVQDTMRLKELGYNDEAEIELYTGFKDSNKLDKVFVGDIIKYSWRNQEKIGQVVDWEFNNSCGFNVSTKGEFLSLGVIEILEILGNIHENPELLGGDK